MFTGLIETTGILESRKMSGEAGKLAVRLETQFESPVEGESIAVNGACLTLESASDDGLLVFHVMRETFSKTNLGTLPCGSVLNLERAMKADGRFGGHIVTGHIDCTAKVVKFEKRASDVELTIRLPQEEISGFVRKGSIAIDGISLTVESIDGDLVRAGIIPTTMRETNLSSKTAGDEVNIESDILGKYVAAYMQKTEKRSTLTMQKLSETGFL